MIVAATPIDPPEDGNFWRFHFINDSTQTIESVIIESVDYEWADMANVQSLGKRFGPIAPGSEVEIHKEMDTEVRTSVTLEVDGHRYYAELGRLYAHSGRLVPIPILGREGKVAAVSRLVGATGPIQS